MVMFSEDVTALDFDDDDDNDGGSGVDEVDVVGGGGDDASLYPSSPEFGARTSATFLRDQVIFAYSVVLHVRELFYEVFPIIFHTFPQSSSGIR